MTCHGAGEIAVPVGPRDEFGVQHVEYEPCPGCPDCLPPRAMQVVDDVMEHVFPEEPE